MKKPKKKTVAKKNPLTLKELASRISFEEMERHQDISELENRVAKSLERAGSLCDSRTEMGAKISENISKMEHRIEMAERWISTNENLFIKVRAKLRSIYSSLSSTFDE